MTMLPASDRVGEWFWANRRRVTGSTERGRLICLPHAGAGASSYASWARLLPDDVSLLPVHLPGREGRRREPPYEDVHALVADLAPAVGALGDRPYAVFGHSLGALVAFELVREVAELGLPMPIGLYVSGRPAPHVAFRGRPLWTLSDADLVAQLRALGGTPQVLLEHPKLLSAFLPALRADLRVNEDYEFKPEQPLDVPITAFAAADDSRARATDMASWADHTTASFALTELAGGHFAVMADPTVVLNRVVADLREVR